MATTNTKDPWRSRLDKILWFLDHASQEKKLELKDTPTQTILMELVSASTLGIPAVDPYCVVFLNDHEVHRTKAIQNDPDPIWTVETNSLCLVDIPLDDGDNLMKIEVNHGYQCLGIVSIKCCDILKKNGAREEFIIRKTLVANDEGEADDNNIIGKVSWSAKFTSTVIAISISLSQLSGFCSPYWRYAFERPCPTISVSFDRPNERWPRTVHQTLIFTT